MDAASGCLNVLACMISHQPAGPAPHEVPHWLAWYKLAISGSSVLGSSMRWILAQLLAPAAYPRCCRRLVDPENEGAYFSILVLSLLFDVHLAPSPFLMDPPLRPGDTTEGRYANAPPPSSLWVWFLPLASSFPCFCDVFTVDRVNLLCTSSVITLHRTIPFGL